MLNTTAIIGSGFEYSIRGTETTGFRVTTSISKVPILCKTLDDAHRMVMRAYNIYLWEVEGFQGSVKGTPTVGRSLSVTLRKNVLGVIK